MDNCPTCEMYGNTTEVICRLHFTEVVKEFKECVELNRVAADSCGEMLTRHMDPSGEYYTGKAVGLTRGVEIFDSFFKKYL